MVLIKNKDSIILKQSNNIINYWRENPTIAASHLLQLDGEPLTLAPIQEVVLYEWWNHSFNLLTASRGFGKCLRFNTKVLTENGWINIQDITLKDKIITPKGTITEVIGIYPQGINKIYKITFFDGRTAYCDHSHIWKIKNNSISENWELINTSKLIKYLEKDDNIVEIPLIDNILLKTFNNITSDPYDIGINLICNRTIHKNYLELNKEKTIELLQGFIDSNYEKLTEDHLICRVDNKNLALQIQSLIWKLGGICKIVEDTISDNFLIRYSLHIYGKILSFFTILGKKIDNRYITMYNNLQILSITEIGEDNTICIKIKDTDGLFIIDDYIITHNTFISAVYIALKCMLYPGTQIGVFAPAFRQSKFIFKEFTRLYYSSPFLQKCIDREPAQLNDQCICTFKQIGKKSKPSSLIALPVGADGGKIRGTRVQEVIMDEIPHLPEAIFRGSIQPMMSNSNNPMKKVAEIHRLKERYGNNYIDYLPQSLNGYIGITSGYYQFNYWWQEIVNFWEQITTKNKRYNLRFVPYTELPEGFYETHVLEDARLNSPNHMFLTEWMAEWISDSAGAFTMSLLESCRDINVIPKYARDENTDKGKRYIFGIDVARERDSTSIVVVELGHISKVVYIAELEETAFPIQAKFLYDLIQKFNPIFIYMDEFGGGGTIRDLLADPRSVGYPETEKIIEIDSPPLKSGKRILKLCNFNPIFIEDANNNAKTLLEQKAIRLPVASYPIESKRKGNDGNTKEVDLVQELINQIASIVVTSTPSGKLHYDLPRGSATGNSHTGSAKVKKKDLYTAFILACKCVYDLEWKINEDKKLITQGIIKEIESSSIKNINNISNIVLGDNKNSIKTVIPTGGIILNRGKFKR